jgi:hypothetical protein
VIVVVLHLRNKMQFFKNGGNEKEEICVVNGAKGASLEETLAKVDHLAECKAENQQLQAAATLDDATASLTLADTSVESLLTLDNTTTVSVFTEQDKAHIRSIWTPINDYVIPFETRNPAVPQEGDKVRFIPILEAPGGRDKDPATGHRRDSIPIATQIALQEDCYEKCASAIFYFLDDSQDEAAREGNAALFRYLRQFATGVVVRVNPGTLSSGAQANLDGMLTDLTVSSPGIRIMTHPHTQQLMGAKDSLVKIRDLRFGLKDTSVYYDAPSFREGFVRSIAFRPRVVKQNRGSQGEGIWIIKLKDETQYCANYGDAVVSLDTELVLVEANDNHVEYHTVGEFLEFAIHGRTDQAGVWESTGTGRYLDGDVESGAMLVDQRFLPRISEGEVRCNMVGSQLVNLVHKVPKSGTLSATLQSGAMYTSYSPDDPKFARLVESYTADLPNIMKALGMEGEPLPLLWTADFIFDYDEQGNDIFYVGEFNCSCVGITQDLYLSEVVAKTAIEMCFQ